MAKIYDEKEVTVTKIERELLRVVCDKCNIEIPPVDPYSQRDFDLLFAAGSNYPEGGYVEGWQVEDLCDDCVDKLKTLLEEWECKVIPYQVDW